MKITIFGAGALGGYIGAKLAQTQAQISLIARGPHLEVMQDAGLTLIEGEGYINVDVIASDTTSFLGEQDYLLLTLPPSATAAALDEIAPLIGPRTTVISMAVGLPWWYFHAADGQFEGTRLASLDPDGALWAAFGPDRMLGCAVKAQAVLLQPGVIRHVAGNQIFLGEPTGQPSARAQKLSALMSEAGIDAPIRPHIREDLWTALVADLQALPLSGPGAEEARETLRGEAEQIAKSLGFSLPRTCPPALDTHLAALWRDIEAGRAPEITAQLAALCELGALLGLPTPSLDQALALLGETSTDQ